MADTATSSQAADATSDVRGAILASLERRDPLIVLTGASRSGKSELYRSIITSSERIAACVILNPFLTFHDLLRQVVNDLQLSGGRWAADEDLALAATEHDLVRLIQGFVESNPQRLVLIVVDDAHLINLVVLSKLRALLNLSAGDHGLTVLLAGQPALETTLQRSEFQSVQQRVAARYRLGSRTLTPTLAPAPAPARARAIAPKPSVPPVAVKPSAPAAAKPGPSSVAALKRREATRQLATTVALLAVVGAVMVWSWHWATSAGPETPSPQAAPRAATPRPPASQSPASRSGAPESPAPQSPASGVSAPPVSMPAGAPPAAVAAPAAPRPTPVPRTAEPPAPEPARGSRGTPNAPPPANEMDATFAALRQSTERRALTLTSKGDVKGLLALRAETGRRFRQLGASRPELLAEVLQALDAKLDEARAIRLRLDAEAIRR